MSDVEVSGRRRRRRRGEISPERLAQREVALRQVRQFGDPVLSTVARPVERFDEQLQLEVERMGKIMDDTLGWGLAASQLGVLRRVFVYRVEESGPINAVVNPTIEWASEQVESMEEGCLSIPATYISVERPRAVRLRGYNEFGVEIVIEATDLEARIIQHETDHLNGVLMLDRAAPADRKLALAQLRDLQFAG